MHDDDLEPGTTIGAYLRDKRQREREERAGLARLRLIVFGVLFLSALSVTYGLGLLVWWLSHR